jgi:membrane fusion protein, multidrug efflux system
MRRNLWVIILCVIAVGAWYHFHSGGDDSGDQGKSGGGHKGGDKNAPIPVGVATAKTGDISVYLTGLGNITPPATVTVHTLINGQLMKILFTEGQMVKKDDMLALIDDRPYTAAFEQAEGMLLRDQALLTEAKIDLARYQELWKKDSIAKQQLDTQASLVKQYEGTVRNDQGQIDAAKTNLIYTKITSPVTGRVGLRQVDEGNIVHTTDANGLVIVTQLQPITAIFTIP